MYELFLKNYTKKQWGVYPDELDPQVTNRLSVRLNRDTRYFTDKYQGIPIHGYTKMFEKMLDNRDFIHILLNTDYKEIRDYVKFDRLIFTGPIDYFLIMCTANYRIEVWILDSKPWISRNSRTQPL